ncbi:MAG TPA: HAD family phosphatase [Vicinamibacterales bacterium]|nr:HAD family phosphatase [Vicinamibacterales bacterium]
MTRAVLWDLDGTLVDSAELHWLSWRDTLAAEGVSITYERFLESFGQKNDRILSAWLAGSDAGTIARIGEAKEAAYRRLAVTHGLTPLPGAADWLSRLRAAGWRQAIASSAPRENVVVMLGALALQDYFDAITSAEDVTAGKPDPQVFLSAASRLDVTPSRCVVVEDAAAGIEAARRAAMRSVGVSRGTRLDADVYVTSLDKLPPETFDRLVEK